MQSITVTLPLPPKALHPNARCHWRSKLAPKKKAREDAYYAANAVKPPKPFAAALVRTVFYLPRKQDPDNLLAWIKSYVDGMQGLIFENDSKLTWLPVEQKSGKSLSHRVEFTFEEITKNGK